MQRTRASHPCRSNSPKMLIQARPIVQHPFASTRDPEKLKRLKLLHFDELWGRVRDDAQSIIEARETSLARALRRVESRWREMSLEDTTGAAYGEPLTLPRAALFGAR